MEDDETYVGSMSRILQDARGPLEDIVNFEQIDPKSPTPEPTSQSDDRFVILRMAALMAVLSLGDGGTTEVIQQMGRRRGTAWAHDHRLAAMGLPRLAHRRQNRSSWR